MHNKTQSTPFTHSYHGFNQNPTPNSVCDIELKLTSAAYLIDRDVWI